jgi:TetR/AcrR family transcriptional regulator
MSLSKFIRARTDEASPKRERRKEARPGELLDAALDLFVEKGFAATRAEEVAATRGRLQRHAVPVFRRARKNCSRPSCSENIALPLYAMER